jgi:hypothetical protein
MTVPQEQPLGEGSTEDAPDFDWEVAVALAGCSFEAYNELESEKGALKEETLNGSNVIYTSK